MLPRATQPLKAVRSSFATGRLRAIGDWKIIEHYEDARTELFNLKTDRAEKNDLSKTESARLEKMRSDLHAWRLAINAQTNSPNPDFDPVLHRASYLDYDITHYDPPVADQTEFARVFEWRRQINAAARNR